MIAGYYKRNIKYTHIHILQSNALGHVIVLYRYVYYNFLARIKMKKKMMMMTMAMKQRIIKFKK